MDKIFADFIAAHHHLCIIQAENPDGDSLGSALALDELLPDHEITLYCPVNIPRYLHYLDDWSRVVSNFDYQADAYIIVDTAAEVLLSKTLADPVAKNSLESKPVLVIDHHETASDLHFEHLNVSNIQPSCTSVIYQLAKAAKLSVTPKAAEYLLAGLLSDTLGLTTESTRPEDYRTTAELLDYGVSIAAFEEHRREFMKKSARILDYKADLIKRVEYHLDGRLATVLIPWDDIREYSDEYNPNVLILEEMRLVEGVAVAVAIKTYPDGKLTGKIRSALPVSETLAGYFGGGGHKYAAGFRIYESYEDTLPELVRATSDILDAEATDA
jgi:phosphoesterase RecJ-like protein